MAKKKAATKTLRPKAATVRPGKSNAGAKPRKAKAKSNGAGSAWDTPPEGESPAAEFGRKFLRMMLDAKHKPATLIEASGVGETTIYSIIRAKLASPPKPGTVRQLDTALAAGGKLVEFYGRCVARAASGSWL